MNWIKTAKHTWSFEDDEAYLGEVVYFGKHIRYLATIFTGDTNRSEAFTNLAAAQRWVKENV